MPATTPRAADHARPRHDPFIGVHDAAASLGSTPRAVLRLVQEGRLFGLADETAPFGVAVLADDVRRIRAAAARPA